MVKELTSPQQQSIIQIIEGILSGLEPKAIEIVLVSIEAEEGIMIVKVADKIQRSRLLGTGAHQSRCGGKEVSVVADKGKDCFNQILKSHERPTIISQQISGSPIPTSIKCPPNPSFFEVSLLFFSLGLL